MTDYEDFQPLHEFLKFQIFPKKHWFNGASWEIAKYIHVKVLKVTKLVVQNSKFISLTCDELIAMDNVSWADVYGYIVQDWCEIPLLLDVQQVFFGFNVNSLILLMMNSLMTQGDLK
jgi:hypothetical protein